MKKYLVSIDVYVELPRGKEHYLLRKMILRVLRKGRYNGIILEDKGLKLLVVEELYLTKAEEVFRTLISNPETINYFIGGES